MSFLYPVHGIDADMPSVAAQAGREAWSMLTTFGEFIEHDIDPLNPTADFDSDDVKAIARMETFDTISTDYYAVDSDETRLFYLDQFPQGQESMCGFAGFVALHMEIVDEDEGVTEYAQIVCRLESHKDGPAVFTGDSEKLNEVIDDVKILEIILGMRMLTAVAWPQHLAYDDKLIKTLPESETKFQMETMRRAQNNEDDQ